MPQKMGNGSNLSASKEVCRADFPPNFVFGVATSAFQIEGASKEGSKGPSIWDSFTQIEGKILDGSNGDVAVDHFHRYKEDIDLIAKLGFEAYRFSISWARIYSDNSGKINEEGITFYNNIINALLEKGIQPYVTLYHWDLPLHLEESIGGWLNKQIVEHFAAYADTCFESFGDRVKNWITINEPLQTAVQGYDTGTFAPGRHTQRSTEPYLAAHHQILAHAAAVSIYLNKYKGKQRGQIGLVVDCEWAEANSSKIEDQAAAARRLEFQVGWFLHPLYHGEYPKVMRDKLGDSLPKFSQEDKELLKNQLDFIGLNHYTSRFIAHTADTIGLIDHYKAQEMKRIVEWDGGEAIGKRPMQGWLKLHPTTITFMRKPLVDSSLLTLAASEWLYVVPWGMRKVLHYISQTYKNTPIFVTENGMDDEDNDTSPLHEMLNDELRVSYFKGYLSSVSQALKEGVDVRGYFAWSLLDNFEWAQGYTKRFGLVYVDYKNGLTRHPKSSAYWFLRFLKGDEEKNGKED